MEKAEGKENSAAVDANKAKEENLEVARGKCRRGFWLSALNATGKIFHQFPLKDIFLITVRAEEKECVVPKPKLKYISETWILPFAVLFAMVAYAILAIVFYNNDG